MRGGIEADVTVTRLSDTSYMIVTIATSQTRDFSWLKRHIPDDARAVALDITSGLPMLALMGPKSRHLLEKVSGEDLSNERLPFAHSREIEIGYARVRASRLTYVGELGYELYMPAEFACHVFDRIVEAGADYGLAFGGFFAINSLRMEKGYRHWGHDIGEEDTPIEAGLGFAVAFDKQNAFIGQDAILSQREAGRPKKRLVHLRLTKSDNAPLLYHEEPILQSDTIIGSVTSGAFGHRVGGSLGLGYVHAAEGVTADFLRNNTFEVEIACERYLAELQLHPFYDPTNSRIKG